MTYDQDPIERVSEPLIPRERRPVLVRVFGRWILWFVALGALVAGGASWAWFNFTAPGPLAEKKIVQLPKDATREQISVALEDQGVISDARIFSAAAALNQLRHAKLRPGEYEFPARATMEDVMGLIASGKFVTYKFTIPEGWTSQMVVSKLAQVPELDGEITQVPEEGAIRPDTYIFQRGFPRGKLLADMQAAQAKLIDQEWPRLPSDSPIKTKHELLTMASIVEKETGVAEERPMVAAVFLNRLKQKMRLQSDPTIIYGLAGGKGKLDHPITRAELDQQTPYNTYQVDGLPPGPIANPGKAAIEAVLQPANVGYLYFVANGTGGHAFATTLDEHNVNVKRWRAQSGDLSAEPQQASPATPKPAPEANQQQPAETSLLPDQTADAPPGPEPAVQTPVASKPAAVVPREKPPVVPARAKPAPAGAPPEGQKSDSKPGDIVLAKGKRIPVPVLKKPKK